MGRKIAFKLMLTPEVHQWLYSEAEARDTSRTAIIMKAIDQYRTREELITVVRRAVREELDRIESSRL